MANHYRNAGILPALKPKGQGKIGDYANLEKLNGNFDLLSEMDGQVSWNQSTRSWDTVDANDETTWPVHIRRACQGESMASLISAFNCCGVKGDEYLTVDHMRNEVYCGSCGAVNPMEIKYEYDLENGEVMDSWSGTFINEEAEQKYLRRIERRLYRESEQRPEDWRIRRRLIREDWSYDEERPETIGYDYSGFEAVEWDEFKPPAIKDIKIHYVEIGTVSVRHPITGLETTVSQMAVTDNPSESGGYIYLGKDQISIVERKAAIARRERDLHVYGDFFGHGACSQFCPECERLDRRATGLGRKLLSLKQSISSKTD